MWMSLPRNSHAAVMAALMLGASGCTMSAPKAPAFAMPDQYTVASDETAPADALPTWWTTFNDSQLTQLIEEALKASPDARAAEAALREATAARRQTLSALWPKGNVEGNVQQRESRIVSGAAGGGGFFDSTEGKTETGSAAFQVSWELDYLGRTPAGRLVANSDYEAAVFRRESARWSLAANVADTLFVARATALQLEDARESQRIQTSIRDIIRVRADAGIVATSDVDRVDSDRLSSEAEVERLNAELMSTKRALLVLVGRGGERVEAMPIDAALASPPSVPQGLPTQLLARRPDVREARARLNSSAGSKRIADLAIFPTFTLLPGTGISANKPPAGESITTSYWSLGVGLSIPVLDLPRLLAQKGVAKARFEQAAIAYEQAAIGAISDADQTLIRLQADVRRERMLTEAEAQARRVYEAREQIYRAGISNLQDYLDAERVWRTARSNLTGVRRDALRRSVAAFKAVGGGWPADQYDAQGRP